MKNSMTRIRNVLLTSAIVLATSAPALAGTPVVDYRERSQQTRIRHGVRSGELSAREAARLEAQQAAIRAEEARARADGVVTARERARLQRDLARTSRRIRRQRGD